MEVTASYAIFPKDGGHEAPGSVVGFKIAHSALYQRFIDITSKANVSSNVLFHQVDLSVR